MRVVNLSYSVPKPNFTDPEAWLRRISFSITVMESMAQYAEVVGIYHIAHRGLLRRNGVTYHFTGYKRWQVMLPFQFNRYIKKLNPDVVIVHGLISPWQIVMLRWQMGRRLKIVVEHHAERPLKDVRQFLQRWADHYITAYLFGSLELGLPWVARKQIRNRNKIRVIIGTASIFLPMEKADARQKLGLATGKVFLWVGRLDRNKDPVTVIRAFERFASRQSGVALYMIYATAGSEYHEGDFFDKYSGLSSAIHLQGEVVHEQLRYWYSSADFIISSSHYEGSGIAVGEALSCGCIPILTQIPSFHTISDSGRLGLLYPAGDEEALLTKLEESLQLDHIALREQVLAWHRQQLSSDAVAKKIVQVLSEESPNDE